MSEEIKKYYNNLAKDYDKDRFGNTYGEYIDKQERKVLNKLLKTTNPDKTLDIACGTGRFLNYANFGIDFSEKMISVSKSKFPEKNLYVKNAQQTDFEDNKFDDIFSFHLFMHLPKDEITKIIDEAYRVLSPNGKLIFDIPSKKRREYFKQNVKGWHGATSFTIEEIKDVIKDDWTIKTYYGILFFPIHKYSNIVRKILLPLDTLLTRSFLKEYSSYLIIELVKNAK